MLARLTSAFVNRIGERSHWRPPVWKKMARQISWKCFELDEVKSVFSRSSTPLTTSKSFRGEERGEERVTDCNPETHLSGISAIAFAKANARGRTGHLGQEPTCRASLVIGKGEGRATREFEIIWWPNIYNDQQRGKVALHFYYVAKVMFTN